MKNVCNYLSTLKVYIFIFIISLFAIGGNAIGMQAYDNSLASKDAVPLRETLKSNFAFLGICLLVSILSALFSLVCICFKVWCSMNGISK